MNRRGTKQPEHRHAPEPEGPEEISRRFQQMNRFGAFGALRSLAGRLGEKSLYVALVAMEVALILLVLFSEVLSANALAVLFPSCSL